MRGQAPPEYRTETAPLCGRVSAVRRVSTRHRHWRWWGFLLVGLVGCELCLSSSVAGTVPARPAIDSLHGGAKLAELIDRVVERQRSLRSLRADFVQVKHSELLLAPVTSTGEFIYLAPDRVRWDFRKPDSMVVLFASDSVTTYHPRQQLAERVRVSRRDRRFVRAMAGTLPLDDMTSQFRVTLRDEGAPAPYCLRLEPNKGSMIRKLDSLVVEIDRKLMLPVVVEYNEKDGDSTRYEFHHLELDPQLEESRFELDLSDGVTLHTLDATSGLG
jgi:outer membrane lipoprotein carrier protein